MGNACFKGGALDGQEQLRSNSTDTVVKQVSDSAHTTNVKLGPASSAHQRPSIDFAQEALRQQAVDGMPYQHGVLGPPRPGCEEDRLATLKALHLDESMTIDAPPDPEIENILNLVTSIFQAPQALVALFDESRIFIREVSSGGGPGSFKRGEFPWRLSFCAWTMAAEQDQIMVIPDATKDSRFCQNPLVKKEGGVRFYVGAPLVASNGHRLGTLCFADTKARDLDTNQANILANFAEMVVRHVEKDVALQLKSKESTQLSTAYRNLKRALDCFDQCVVLVDTSTPDWTIKYTNPAWDKITGTSRAKLQGQLLSDVLEQGGTGCIPSKPHCDAALAGKSITLENVRLRNTWVAANCTEQTPSLTRSSVRRSSSSSSRVPSSSTRKLVIKLRPAATGPFDKDGVGLALPPWLTTAQAANDTGLYFMTVELADTSSGLLPSRMSLSVRSKASSTSSNTPVPGLTLGHLLGSGSFGTVYAGSWYSTAVAIKVINHDMKSLAASGVQMEALLGSELRHPHVVATLTYASRSLDQVSTSHFSDDTAKEGSSTPPSSSLQQLPPLQQQHAPAGHVAAASPSTSALSNVLPAGAAADGASTTTATSSSSNVNALAAAAPLKQVVEDVPATAAAAVGSRAAVGSKGVDTSDSSAMYPVIDLSDSAGGSAFMQSGNCLWRDFDMSKVSEAGEQVKGGHHQTWIILEYCDQGSLQDAIDRGRLRLKDASGSPSSTPNMAAIVSTAHEIASALLYLHSHGIVHGDLSAWNVLLTTSGPKASLGDRGFVAKVADFGLSRSLDFKTRVQTRTYGTITHQPPETLIEGMISRSTDCYSLGVLLWQMFTGSRPWVGRSHAQIIMAVASRSASLKFPAEVPDDYAALAYACMSWAVEDRPSLEEVCIALNAMKHRYCQ